MKKKGKGKKNPGKAVKPGHEETRVQAYYRWQKRGSPEGDSLTDWLASEEQNAAEAEGEWEGEEKRWTEENPQDEEPGEAP